jgi:hypothetical protein
MSEYIISIKMDVCLSVCPGITLERLEQFQPNLVHILLYCMCKNLMYVLYIFRREDGVGGKELG